MSELLEPEPGKRRVVHVPRASVLGRSWLLYGTISNACTSPFKDRQVHVAWTAWVSTVKSMTTAARDHLNGAVAGSAVMSSAGSRTTASSRKEHPAMATPGTVRAAVIRAVTYRRVSTFGQLGGTSPETQLERALAIINRESWQHVGDFFDGGVSGAKESRPDLDRLFEMCRAGLVDVVVVGDLSRLSRDLRNSLNFEHELHQLGVEVIDADNPNADELARMFSYLQNHWMRDQIRKNTHRGILAVAEAGYWPVGTAPFGWRIVPAPDNPKRKTVVVDEAETATIRKAVELVVDEGLSCWKAAPRLNALGHLPRHSARWNNVSLRWMLKGTHFAGEWVLRKAGREIPIRGPAILSAER